MKKLNPKNFNELLVTSHNKSVNQLKELDEENYAVLIAAVCEEIGQPLDRFKIVEIKEIY